MSYIEKIVVGWHKNSTDTNGQIVLTGLSDDTGLVDFEDLANVVLTAVTGVVGIDSTGGTVFTVTDSAL